MKKSILLLFLFITVSSIQLYSQTSANFLNGYIISLKGGYHTEDKVTNSYHIQDGLAVDGTLEFHTGKNWYVGVNADLSFSNDTYNNVNRTVVVFSYTPILKYRFFLRDVNFNFGAGMGASSVTINGYNDDKMLNLNLRAGMDLKLSRNLMASFEAAFNKMLERKNDGGRTNQMAMVKIGLSYFIANGK
jgi:hypothetical protein